MDEIAELRKKRQWSDRDLESGKGATIGPECAAPQADKPHELSLCSGQSAVDADTASDKIIKNAHAKELVGLSFSGGGIRSATFNLGVLEGLAEFRRLRMFDYLSTVSGGGYIGSWLTSWILRSGDVRSVEESLKPDRTDKPHHQEPRQIRFLREYSNYLTPRLGLLGADTWAAVAIYTRNLLLNQAILILFLFSLLLIPHILVWITLRASDLNFAHSVLAAPATIFLLAGIGQIQLARNMRAIAGSPSGKRFPQYTRQGWILWTIAAPLFLSAWITSVWLWQLRSWEWSVWTFLAVGAAGFGMTWTIAARWNPPRAGAEIAPSDSWKAWLLSIFFALLSGAAGGLLLRTVADKLFQRWIAVDGSIWHVVSFGTPIIVIVFLLTGALQLGLTGRLVPDPRREWWGRLGGWLLIISIAWAAAFGLAIYSPIGVMWLKDWMKGISAAWLINTGIAVIGGQSARTGSRGTRTWKDTALSVTPYIFIVGLVAGLSWILELVLAKMNADPAVDSAMSRFLAGSPIAQKMSGWVITLDATPSTAGTHQQGVVNAIASTAEGARDYIWAHWDILDATFNYKLLIPFGVCVGLCILLAYRVDLNEFSMNLFYRNRLVRCYLGATRENRNYNPFTGFDQMDDLPLKNLRSDACYSGPLPIVNTTLNLVKGKNLAWQERMSESFTMTPLRCGFDVTLEKLDMDDDQNLQPEKLSPFSYRPTTCYAYEDAGLRLGTAVSISGAAASPNMGYHTSPALAFLMTFFNVRLGFWAGNPRNEKTWTRPGPTFGLMQLLDELFGQTDDEAKYVYLSDGGHFENLGVYELVKRRCKYILACDAGADGSYAFGDLGGAIRKCREDFGIEIRLDTTALEPRGEDKLSKWHCAVGTILYSQVDPGAKDGTFVYLKASLTGEETADVLNYHREHPDFPHQTTANQWFTESQFESYRRLGQHVIEAVFAPLDAAKMERMTTSEFFTHLKESWPAPIAGEKEKPS
ncbi:MAG: patatin-like phospholipase family protein [Candidatus Acidiferrales bacterium]